MVDVSWHEPEPVVKVAEQVSTPEPSLTVTLPVGVPVPGATLATETLTAYGSPTTVAVVRLEVMVVAVAALFTVCGVPAEALVRKLASPA